MRCRSSGISQISVFQRLRSPIAVEGTHWSNAGHVVVTWAGVGGRGQSHQSLLRPCVGSLCVVRPMNVDSVAIVPCASRELVACSTASLGAAAPDVALESSACPHIVHTVALVLPRAGVLVDACGATASMFRVAGANRRCNPLFFTFAFLPRFEQPAIEMGPMLIDTSAPTGSSITGNCL